MPRLGLRDDQVGAGARASCPASTAVWRRAIQFVEAALRIARTGALWRDRHPSSSSVASSSLAVVRSSDLALR